MKLMILMITACILWAGYIDTNTYETELTAQNLTNYTAFETITQEELQAQRDFEEKRMREMQILIDKAK